MQNSKLHSILANFNKYELNRLRKFITSPYFNKNESLIVLFDVMVTSINEGNSKKLEKEYVWSLLYPGTTYDDVLFRKNCSDLLKLIEDFLSQQVYEENPIYPATFLIEAVGKRKLERLFNSTMKTARRLSEQYLYKTAEYYLFQFQIEKNYYDLSEQAYNRTSRKNVEEILNNLDRFFLAEKLRFYCSVLSQQSIVSYEYKLLFIDEIIQHIEKYSFDDVPPVAIYYQIFKTYTETENTEHYFRLIKLLEKYGDLFPKKEAEFMYQAALNYCIRKLNQGSREFLEEYFNLSVILLQKELLLKDGELSPWDFRNIVVIALRLGKYKWTEDFIQEYKSLLPESFRDNAVTFNLAQLHFYQKNYDKVIELLQTVEYEDFSYNLNSKVLLMNAYYEIEEIEPLYSLLESFRAYLNRHKNIPASRRNPYNNLIKFTKKLTRIMPGDKNSIAKMREEIEKSGEGTIANTHWLKEKLAELE